MSIKEFKTIDEQISILKSRGLTISNYENAYDFLYKNNYYRISGYTLTLRNHDIFYKGVDFQNIIDIYEFDHELRNILLKYIEVIEVMLKSIYAYEFSKKYGPNGYLDSDNFEKKETYDNIMKKAEKQKESRHGHEAYLKHFIEELGEPIPIWAYVDLLTIADISFLYSISNKELKKSIANSIMKSANSAKKDKILEASMHEITIIRNLCAHGSRLYNRLFEQKPLLNQEEKGKLIIKSDGTIDNDHLYGFILIMKKILDPSVFILMKAEIICLTKKYPFVNMKYYGFRSDWKKKL